MQKRLAAYRRSELDEDELTDAERAQLRRDEEAAARIRAERERISREAGSWPVTVEELEQAQLDSGMRPGQPFPRLNA